MSTATHLKPLQKRNSIVRFLPIFGWLPRYNTAWLAGVIGTKLTMWGLVVPEAMVYAGIAGLPPQAGFHTLVVSLAEILKGLIVRIQGKGITIFAAEMYTQVREFAQQMGLLEVISEDHISPLLVLSCALSNTYIVQI